MENYLKNKLNMWNYRNDNRYSLNVDKMDEFISTYLYAIDVMTKYKKEENKGYCSGLSYQNEFASISLNFGRQTAKTTTAMVILDMVPDAIYICHRNDVANHLRLEFPWLKRNIFGHSEFINKYYSRGTYNHVVVGSNKESHRFVILDEPKYFCTQGQRQGTNKNHCSYPSGLGDYNLLDLIQYAAYQMNAVTIMLGDK